MYSSDGIFSAQMFSWLEWVIAEDRPFAFVEDKLTRKYDNINGDDRSISLRYLATGREAVLLSHSEPCTVSTTTNICERLLSRGKFIYIDRRGSLDPSTLKDI